MNTKKVFVLTKGHGVRREIWCLKWVHEVIFIGYQMVFDKKSVINVDDCNRRVYFGFNLLVTSFARFSIILQGENYLYFPIKNFI